MHKDYIVYQGKAYSSFKSGKKGYYLLSDDRSKLSEGYEEYPTLLRTLYRKFVPIESIDKRYRIIDYAIINGRRYGIDRKSDDHYDQPDSWISVATSNPEELKEDGLWDNVIIEDVKYGHKFYHSDIIPVSKVQILRVREDVPL